METYVGGSITPISLFTRRKLSYPNAFLSISSETIVLDAFGLKSRGPLVFNTKVTDFVVKSRKESVFIGLRDSDSCEWHWFKAQQEDGAELIAAIKKSPMKPIDYLFTYSDLTLLNSKGAVTFFLAGLVLLLLVVLFGHSIDHLTAKSLPPRRPVGSVSYALTMLSIGITAMGAYASSIHLLAMLKNTFQANS